MNAVKPPYNVKSYTQAYVLKELDDAENIRREVSVILQEREKLAEFLKSLDAVQKVYPSEANFILFKIKNSQRSEERRVGKESRAKSASERRSKRRQRERR